MLLNAAKMSSDDAVEIASRLQAVLDTAVDGIVTIDAAGKIESFNKACERIFGYQADEVIGKSVNVLMPQPYQSEHDAYLSRYQETREAQIIGIGREVQGRRADGSLFPLDLAVSEVQLAGKVIYTGIIRDITRRKTAEDALRTANRELEEFSYRVSHDLRGPLRSALGLLDVVQSSLAKGKQELAAISVAKAMESVQRLDSLLDDLMSLAEVRHLDEEAVTVNVEAILKEALHKYAAMAQFERLKVVTDLQITTLVCKRQRLQTIMENLISNAVKYQDLDKAESYVKITTRRETNVFILEVLDNGLGIPNDQQERVFDMFARFHPRVSSGSGLGLYKVRQCALDMAGQVEYEGLADGSVFRLRLPGR